MQIIRYFIFLALIVSIAFTGTSCKRWVVRHQQRKDLRALEQKQREKDKEKMQKYQEAVKRHASVQDKKTRKAMKRQYRKAQRYNSHQKEFFIKRWFKGKRRTQSNPQRQNRE